MMDHIARDSLFCRYKASHVAAAMVLAARQIARLSAWSRDLEEVTHYREEEIRQLAEILCSKLGGDLLL